MDRPTCPYEPWWYEAWIRHLLWGVKDEMAGVLVRDPDSLQWGMSVMWGEEGHVSDELQARAASMHPVGSVIPFHTHPHASYMSSDGGRTSLGGPSMADVLLFLRHAVEHGQDRHLIFTKEGIYRMGLGSVRLKSITAMDLENCRLRLEAYPDWAKHGRFRSIETTLRCRRLEAWLGTVLPVFRLTFHDYFTPFFF